MNILICSDALGVGGAETHILSLVRELVGRGHCVTVAATSGALVSELPRQAEFVPLPPFGRAPQALLCSHHALRRLIDRRPRFDVVHAHARLPARLLRAMTRRRRIPLVVTAHAMFRMTPMLAWLSVWGERTIAVSRDIEQLLVLRGRVPKERICVIPNGIDTSHFCPAPRHNGDVRQGEDAFPHIIFVSRLDNDCSSVARALCHIAGRLRAVCPQAVVTIVGGGDCLGELEVLSELMNAACGARVISLAGARTEVCGLLRRADIFVGVSRAAMEAAACGLPVILAGDEGYGGIFRPGETVDSANLCARGREAVPSLQDALLGDICSLLQMGAESRRELGLAGRDYIRRHYSSSSAAERTLEVYGAAMAHNFFKKFHADY